MVYCPSIGVTIGKDFYGERWRYHCPDDYVRAVASAGGAPVLLPGATIAAAGPGIAARLDGLLLSGGGDLDPAHFGQEPHPANGPVDAERDRAELDLVAWALEEDLPILAICRGMQVLNVALGGDLIQDLPSAGYPGHKQDSPSRAAKAHRVAPVPGTALYSLAAGPYMVNSFHHQAVGSLAGRLAAAAYADDGLVEAVVYPGRPVIGVQWHPESYAHEAPEAAALFAWLVRESARRKGSEARHFSLSGA